MARLRKTVADRRRDAIAFPKFPSGKLIVEEKFIFSLPLSFYFERSLGIEDHLRQVAQL